jgi:hypothetical protein
MNAEINYSMWHCYKGSENADDCREINHSLKSENRLQHVMQQVQWRSPESLQCHDLGTNNPIAVPRWHFAVCQTATLQTKYIFLQKKLHFVRNWRSKVISGDTETKTTLSECELHISEKSISSSFKQAPKRSILYRTKVMINFTVGGMPKNLTFLWF